MDIKSFIGGTCVCIVCASFNASAEIISIEWQTAGDNLITRDTLSGLEWLDLTATSGRSYNDISSKFGVGQEFDGWRYATQTEISGFFDAFGGDSAYYAVPPTVNAGWSTQNNGLFDEVAGFWGDLTCVATGCATGDGASNFIALETEFSHTHLVGWIYDLASNSNSLTQDYVTLGEQLWDDTWIHPEIGSALVRVSSVPIPGAVWLFGSGLIGLIGIARRKKS